MQAEIIFTGTELLLGEVLNTHAQYLGREMTQLGIEITRHTAVGDNRVLLEKSLCDALARTDLLFITGGLGPTEDDLTGETVAGFLGLDMVIDPATMGKLEDIFSRRGAPVPESIKKQALVPRGAQVLPNHAGTAPGLIIRNEGKIIIMLPGPPRELKAVFGGSVRKFLATATGGIVMHSIVLKVTGLSESQVQDRLQKIHATDNPAISYVAMPGEVHVRVTARTRSSEPEARQMAGEMAARVEDELRDYVFGRDDEQLEETLGELLVQKKLTVSVAESCTGGLIMKRITDVSGSSRYFLGGVVSYSNALKAGLLGVPGEIIARYGAVSEQTARTMAEGISRMTGSSLGVGVTGIAGPEGGNPEKPVGLVYIALAAPDRTYCYDCYFPGRRIAVRAGAANTALNIMRRFLLAY
ncbi:MAG: competence/damage-inducible protein A [Firmicutes bacterium]|nr:competence/damage-inducible protein A [Bacillota bacterium]